MKKVLITGGAGFIGFHLANKLLRFNYKIDLLDNFSRGIKDQQLNLIKKNPKVNIINADLLVAATLLLDIGKIKALSDELDTDYKTTNTNELIENRIINLDIIKTAILNIEGFPQNITDKLECIIITKDRESIKSNKNLHLMPEALIVELIYKIDGTLNN